MDAAHHLVLLAGVPELPSVFPGLFSARFGTPILLVFLAIGMLFGKEGPVSLVFNCTQTAYLIGSAALAVNLGAQDEAQHAQNRVWPAVALARAGVAITAGVVCTVFALFPPPPSPSSAWVAANRGYPFRQPTRQRWPCACAAPGFPFPSGSPRHLRRSPVSMTQCRFF